LEDRAVPTLLGQQLFPEDNPWNQDISSAPVAANSAANIAHIGTSTRLTPNWYADDPANGASPLYGMPFIIVHGNCTPGVQVVIDNFPAESDNNLVPIPASAVLEDNYQNGPNPNGSGYGENGNPNQRGDSHLLIGDADNNIAYELYGVSRPNDPTLFPNNSDVAVFEGLGSKTNLLARQQPLSAANSIADRARRTNGRLDRPHRPTFSGRRERRRESFARKQPSGRGFDSP
jgi:hypothetical protein